MGGVGCCLIALSLKNNTCVHSLACTDLQGKVLGTISLFVAPSHTEAIYVPLKQHLLFQQHHIDPAMRPNMVSAYVQACDQIWTPAAVCSGRFKQSCWWWLLPGVWKSPCTVLLEYRSNALSPIRPQFIYTRGHLLFKNGLIWFANSFIGKWGLFLVNVFQAMAYAAGGYSRPLSASGKRSKSAYWERWV